jgi:hypothetical protein
MDQSQTAKINLVTNETLGSNGSQKALWEIAHRPVRVRVADFRLGHYPISLPASTPKEPAYPT